MLPIAEFGLTVCAATNCIVAHRSTIHDMPGSTTVTSFGRVISVRGSLARVGLMATSHMGLSEIRATVGRFVSIRCTNSTIVAMITEVSCENLPTSDNYIASASVDLLGEILGGPDRQKFQRGVTHYPTIGDVVELISSAELRTVYAPSGADQINVGTLQQDRSVIAYVYRTCHRGYILVSTWRDTMAANSSAKPPSRCSIREASEENLL